MSIRNDKRAIKALLRKAGATMDGHLMTNDELNEVSDDMARNGQLQNLQEAVAAGAKIQLMKLAEHLTEEEVSVSDRQTGNVIVQKRRRAQQRGAVDRNRPGVKRAAERAGSAAVGRVID